MCETFLFCEIYAFLACHSKQDMQSLVLMSSSNSEFIRNLSIHKIHFEVLQIFPFFPQALIFHPEGCFLLKFCIYVWWMDGFEPLFELKNYSYL